MRIFAGPNGSGKSTIFNQIDRQFDTGYYINPDLIESSLKNSGVLKLSRFGIATTPQQLESFAENHSLVAKAQQEGYQLNLRVEDNSIISSSDKTHSYEASLLADFIRTKLITLGRKLTFETVMSHSSKINVLSFAIEHSYKNYLYFICTSSPKINVDRVNLRVKKGGHPVDRNKIEERYFRTLGLLRKAVEKTYRSFIWDNSGKTPELILEVYLGKEVTFYTERIPAWVNEYLL